MNKKVLLITEGDFEEKFFKHIASLSLLDLKIEIVTVRANLYALYNRMEFYEFANDVDLKTILLEILPNDKKAEYKVLLQQKFESIYLVFDLDCQHYEPNEKQANINNNFQKISKMLNYFNDEFQNGKLYINYPMMESFKDINSFDDIEFISSYISVDDIKNYKSMVSSKRLNGKDILSYSIDNFISIFKLNTNKLFFINGINQKDKNTFLKISKGINIYYKIKDKIDKDCMIYILNTSIFFLSDFRTFNDKYLNSILQ